jgi:curli biogenesis system outer membrane secretion channel CsgG
MRKVLLTVVVPVLAIMTLAIPPVSAQANRPTVALMDFDFGSVQRWWSGNWDIGKGIADLIVESLVEDGSYRVIERKRLDAILAEQNFSNSDRADPDAGKVAKLGKALGVKYLIVGSITKFGTENKDTKIGGGGFGGGKLGIGGVGKSSGKATVAITARMVDTSTGEVMAVAKGEGTSKRSGFSVSGGAFGGVGGAGGISMGSSDFRETVLGEATEAAVKQTSEKLIGAKGRLGT